jgi:uncharacterized OsmC-like protein
VTAPASSIRRFELRASSAPEFGRVLVNARHHHIVVDGPVYNGCPGEALTPPELFLSAIASCGVELMHVIARDENIPLSHATITIEGTVDRDRQPRSDITLFNTIKLLARLRGVSRTQATSLVEGFKRRCPIFGTVSAGAQQTLVEYEVE